MLIGIISIIQAVFAPGYLILRIWGKRTGSITETAVLIFILSLLCNYLFALLMTRLGVYTRIAVIAFIATEVLLFICLTWRWWRKGSPELDMILYRIQPTNWISNGVVVLTAIAVLGSTAAALRTGMTVNVFDSWDTLFSWNRWALLWASGQVPPITGMYPQLVPANWSMMYILTGSPELQLFPVSIMPLFAAAIPLMFFDLGLRKGRLEYFLGLLVCLFMAWQTRFVLLAQGENAFLGYVDIPAAFMVAASFYLLELHDDRLPACWSELAFPLMAACAASVTKLNGFFAIAVVLSAAALGHWKKRKHLKLRGWVLSGLLAVSALAIVPGTWFAAKAVDFAHGRDASGFGLYGEVVARAGNSDDLAARLAHAMSLWPWPPTFLVAIAAAVALGVFVRRSRWVVLGIIIPYTLLWANFLSYDLRNWFAMIPVVAYAAAFGVGGVMEKLLRVDMNLTTSKTLHRMPRGACMALATAVLLCIALVSALIPSSTLVTRSLEKQRGVGNPELNAWIYEQAEKNPAVTNNFLVDYAFLQFLPGFRSDPSRLDHTYGTDAWYFYHRDLTPAVLDGQVGAWMQVGRNGELRTNRESPDGGWDCLLISNLVIPEVESLVQSRIASGEYSVLGEFASGPFMAYAEPVTLRLIRVNKVAAGAKQ